MKMKKLTIIFGALLFSCLIINSCSSDNKNEKDNTTSNKISEEEKNIIALAQKTCELCNMSLDLRRAEESDNFEVQIELDNKLNEGYEALGDLDSLYSISAKTKNQQNLDKDFELFKKELIKCKDSLENWFGYEEMLESWKSSAFSIDTYDEKDEEYSSGQSIESDALELSNCICKTEALSSLLDEEYSEEKAMEFEAYNEYCNDLMAEMEDIYDEEELQELAAVMMQYYSENCEN